MKNILLIVLIVSCPGKAQSQNASMFDAEGATYYEITNCKPHTTLLFHDEEGGGQLIRTVNLGLDGHCIAQGTKEFRPAMVFNKGNGKTYFFDKKEFVLDNLSVYTTGNFTTFQWEANITSGNEIDFEVPAGKDGTHFMAVETIKGSNFEGSHLYRFDGTFNYYRLKVINKQTGVRYLSKVKTLKSTNIVSVYPTNVKDRLTIEIPSEFIGSNYKILNGQGQAISEGVLNDVVNSIMVTDLAAGLYIVEMGNENSKVTKRFIKS